MKVKLRKTGHPVAMKGGEMIQLSYLDNGTSVRHIHGLGLMDGLTIRTMSKHCPHRIVSSPARCYQHFIAACNSLGDKRCIMNMRNVSSVKLFPSNGNKK